MFSGPGPNEALNRFCRQCQYGLSENRESRGGAVRSRTMYDPPAILPSDVICLLKVVSDGSFMQA